MAIDSSIHNYTEYLVTQRILYMKLDEQHDIDFLADLSCVALNNLPPTYIRNDIDLLSYISDADREELDRRVAYEVEKAYLFLREDRRQLRRD